MNIKQLVKETKQAQKEMIKFQKQVDANISTLDSELPKAFSKKWEETFPGVPVKSLSMLQCGCHASGWKPEVHIYYINDLVLTEKGWTERTSGKYYDSAKFVTSPVPEDSLEEFRESFKKEFGVAVTMTTEKVLSAKNIERICDTDDLQCAYGPFEILEEAKIWSIGWDIPDPLVVGRFPDGHIETWYSTNGHGFGFDIHVEKDEVKELDAMYEMLENNNTTIDTTKEQILDSWK
jgi:hypothetical protein